MIASHLRGAILAGALKPGERLPQEKIAEQHGTSRNPVREALRQLENEGLVTLMPHSGARVARPSYAECVELFPDARGPRRISDRGERAASEHGTDRRIDASRSARRSVTGELARLRPADIHLQSFAAAPMPHLLEVIEELSGPEPSSTVASTSRP